MPSIAAVSLYAGVAVPVAYFVSQALAAPFFPDFSVLKHAASLLGSPISTSPSVLNAGAATTGLLALFASLGPVLALRSSGRMWVGLLLSVCLVSFGLASLWAASFPLPDPRHDPGPLGAGMFLAPFAALLAAYVLRLSGTVRLYTALNVAAFFAVAATYSGLIPLDLSAYSGLLQRIGAVVMLGPFAVVCYSLLPRVVGLPTAGASAA